MSAVVIGPEALTRRRREREQNKRWPRQPFEGSLLDALAEDDEDETTVPAPADTEPEPEPPRAA